MTTMTLGLPDPDTLPEFYADIPSKRALAWVVDVIAICAFSLLLTPLTLFTSLFYFPVFYFCVGYAYRVATLARGSATWGMRLMSIEIRDHRGAPLSLGTAFLHTTGYAFSIAMFPLQLISAVTMLATPRAQGLTDMVMGSAAINRSVT
ncbi:RDD family protein [Maribius pontilimi]|uniref:RDD family protein n=1 Tax=Palleronia pontilimi TaxID=1964209 RepID=A0A934IE18_9RHOB|nr:RDD family protein [Palleronia pontilimi]MBJ3761755.1 RDD family protein [Palleronia pontilimi]